MLPAPMYAQRNLFIETPSFRFSLLQLYIPFFPLSSIIENFTELGTGGGVNRFIKRMANSKAGRALGIGYISDLVGKVGSTPFAKKMGKFMERTHWDGMIEEPLEEEYGVSVTKKT